MKNVNVLFICIQKNLSFSLKDVYLCLAFSTSLALSSPSIFAKVLLVESQPELGFNFPYALRIPEGSMPDKYALLVETNNTGNHDKLVHHQERVLTEIDKSGVGVKISKSLHYPLLVPIFPRRKSDDGVYTHALDEDTLKIKQGSLKRLDLQLIAMIEDASKRLKHYDLSVPQKFVMVGFSASGTFANRFSMLHPNKLIAVAFGGINAVPILPLKSASGNKLHYPVGVYDLKEISGQDSELTQWASLPQFMFMGADDQNDAVMHDDAFSEKSRETIYHVLGKDMQTRWFSAQKIYLEFGANVDFVTFAKTGHWTNTKINEQMAQFIKYYVNRYKPEETQTTPSL